MALVSTGPTAAEVFEPGRLIWTLPSTVKPGYSTGQRDGLPLTDLRAGQVAKPVGMFDWLSGRPATDHHTMRFHLKKRVHLTLVIFY